MHNSATDIAIIEATEPHIPVIVEMWQSIDDFPQVPRPFGGDSLDKPEHAEHLIRHAIHADGALVLLAITDKEQVVGTISGHLFEKPAVNITHVGVVYSLWVDEDYRRRGIAKQLLSALEQGLTNKGAQAFQVGWDTGNTTAAQWWQQQGYAPYETIASKVVDNKTKTIKSRSAKSN